MSNFDRIRAGAVLLLAAFLVSSIVGGPGFLDNVVAADIAVVPKSASLSVNDLRPGFKVNPDANATFEGDRFGIQVYETDFTRSSAGVNGGPIKVNNLVARTASQQQATEQFDVSRQALLAADTPWIETPVARLGDMSAGLSFRGTLPDGPQGIAHLFLFRRGAMVVGITITGPEKSTKMAEAEALASIVLRKIDPSAQTPQPSAIKSKPLTQKPPSINSPGQRITGNISSTSSSSTSSSSATSSSGVTSSNPRIKVATGGVNLRLRVGPSLRERILAGIPDGTILEVIGADRPADGYTWKNVKTPSGATGWVAGQFTVPVATTPVPTPPLGSNTRVSSSSSSPSFSSASASSSSSSFSSATATPTARPTQTPVPTATPVPTLTVNVTFKSSEIFLGAEQVIFVLVTRDGKSVGDATVRAEAQSSGASETVNIPETDDNGFMSASWRPSFDAGSVTVNVNAAKDGIKGSGSGSFRMK